MANKGDLSWLVRWARVSHKVKEGATGNDPVVLTPDECADLTRGIQVLLKESANERHGKGR